MKTNKTTLKMNKIQIGFKIKIENNVKIKTELKNQNYIKNCLELYRGSY